MAIGRVVVAATAAVAATALGGALLFCLFTMRPFASPAGARPVADDGRAGSGVSTAPFSDGSPDGLPDGPARAHRPITVAPVSGDGHEPARAGPPMSRDMAVGAVLVAVGSGIALAVLYRTRTVEV